MKTRAKIIVITVILMQLFANISIAETNSVYDLYVSPNGNDNNDAGRNSPVRTVQRALDLYKTAHDKNEKVSGHIYIHAGTYNIDSGLKLTSSHSNLAIKPYGDGEVKISGAKKIDNKDFKKVKDGDDILDKIGKNAKENLYCVDLSGFFPNGMEKYPQFNAQESTRAYYELYADSKLQTLARWPNEGYVLTGKALSNTEFYCTDQRASAWKDEKDTLAFGYWRYDWAGQPIMISDVGTDGKITLLKSPRYGIISGMRYYVFNSPSELDIPGEYYIDTDKKMLYYYPNVDIEQAEFELTFCRDDLVSVNSAADLAIEDIVFEGSRLSGISAYECDGLSVSGVTVRNMGRNAIGAGGTGCIVENCKVYNIGGSGISIWGGDKNELTPRKLHCKK